MPDNPLADVGFADFVAVLLVETLDSIVASHTSQEERLRALDAASSLSAEEFAATAVTPELLAAALVRLFPDGEGGTTVVVGGAAPDEEARETLDLVLADGDVDGTGLTAQGVDAVRDAVVAHLARTQREAVQEVARRGVPRVLVDGGTLRAKVNFTAVRSDDEEPEEATAGGGGGGAVRPLTSPALDALSVRSSLVALHSPLTRGVLDSIRTTRLRVVQPIADDDGGASTTATVSGEVEIRFRTEL